MHEIQPLMFYKVNKLIGNVEYNTLFARSVIENHVKGQVFIDDISDPKTAYIRHPYGMSLLVGCHTNQEFNKWFLDYISGKVNRLIFDDWMQVFPYEWNAVMENKFINNGIAKYIKKCTRVNFSFNLSRYKKIKKQFDDTNIKIEKMNSTQFAECKGTVIPRLFWDSYEDIDKEGIAYVVNENDNIASIAFSAYIHGDKLELGIETSDKFRQKGYAFTACTKLIDYCLLNKFEPIWSCKLENFASYRLAIKMGFDEKAQYPYYGLINPNSMTKDK